MNEWKPLVLGASALRARHFMIDYAQGKASHSFPFVPDCWHL